MNMINEALIDLLISAAETLRNETCMILQNYRTKRDYEKNISSRYKDEEAYFQQEQRKLAAAAREDIKTAEKAFTAKVMDYAGQMEEQLKKHLSMPVNSQFREKLSMLADFGIQPEKIEIDDLLRLNAGNQIGLTALAKTLEKVDSPYVLKYHTTADFQNDIAKIRDLVRNLKYIPTDYHSEGCEIFKGTSADLVLPNGRTIGNGITYDSISLLSSNAAFESAIEEIKGMKDIWSTDCSYDEADKTADEQQKEQKLLNKFLTEAGLPAEELSKPESGTVVADNPENSEGIKIAKQMGRDTARARNTYNELIKAAQML